MSNPRNPDCDVCIEVPGVGTLPDLGEFCWEVILTSDGTAIAAATVITLIDINAFAAGTAAAVPASGLTILSSSVELPIQDCQVAIPAHVDVSYPVGIPFATGNSSRVSDGVVSIIAGNANEPYRRAAKQCFEKCGWCIAINSTASVAPLAQPMGNGYDICPAVAVENRGSLANRFRIAWTTGAAFTPPSGFTIKTTVSGRMAGTKGDCNIQAYISNRVRNACDTGLPTVSVRDLS